MKLTTLTLTFAALTLSCFAVSYGASVAGNLNQDQSYPASLAAPLGGTASKPIAIDLAKNWPASGIESLDLGAISVKIEVVPSVSGDFEFHLQAKLPLAKAEDALELEANGTTLRARVEEQESQQGFFSFSSLGGGEGGVLRVGLPTTAKALVVKTVSGEQEIRARELASLQVKSVSGTISVKAGRVDSLDAKNVSGELQAEGNLGEVKAHSVSGSIKLRYLNPAPATEIKSVSGDSRLFFHETPSLRIEVRTVSGGVSVDPAFSQGNLSGRKFSFTLGEGKGSLHAGTTSGSLSLERF